MIRRNHIDHVSTQTNTSIRTSLRKKQADTLYHDYLIPETSNLKYSYAVGSLARQSPTKQIYSDENSFAEIKLNTRNIRNNHRHANYQHLKQSKKQQMSDHLNNQNVLTQNKYVLTQNKYEAISKARPIQMDQRLNIIGNSQLRKHYNNNEQDLLVDYKDLNVNKHQHNVRGRQTMEITPNKYQHHLQYQNSSAKKCYDRSQMHGRNMSTFQVHRKHSARKPTHPMYQPLFQETNHYFELDHSLHKNTNYFNHANNSNNYSPNSIHFNNSKEHSKEPIAKIGLIYDRSTDHYKSDRNRCEEDFKKLLNEQSFGELLPSFRNEHCLNVKQSGQSKQFGESKGNSQIKVYGSGKFYAESKSYAGSKPSLEDRSYHITPTKDKEMKNFKASHYLPQNESLQNSDKRRFEKIEPIILDSRLIKVENGSSTKVQTMDKLKMISQFNDKINDRIKNIITCFEGLRSKY